MVSKIAGTDVVSWLGIGGGSSPAASGHGKAHVSTESGNGAAVSSAPNKDVENAVRTMQKLMQDLGSQLSQKEVATNLLASLKNPSITVQYIIDMGKKFSATAAAGLGKAPTDGVWGGNTKTSLQFIQKFVQDLGFRFAGLGWRVQGLESRVSRLSCTCCQNAPNFKPGLHVRQTPKMRES